ncbi:DNA-directed RNA polymerase, mitochondrial-like isoform X1 [Herpailurus yagouaroundi]|uniref:DNA-directed RNA polymerase, mitochondrial-like isoform X1 n=1 Tax=Herpailurus yagouaroundi TaxID=1608482 RepID=UPI001AD7144F|nr:DNA-directed RNA polymerase, mitochondrial-like isoform X1 [Puma yagouaroundi]
MGRSRGGSGPGGAAPLTGDPDCHRRKGLTFVSVHDCFWTHAADVEVMNQVCREQFVRLHSQPILHNLSRFLMKRFCSGSRFSAPSPSAAGTTPPCPTGPHAHPALRLRSPQHLKSMRTGKLQDTLKSVPKTGAFDLKQVKHSTYFFS